MAKPILERNGESDIQETISGTPVKQDVSVSPVVETESPVKWVVFRSKDKELALFLKAGYTEKSHGVSIYHPSVGVQFIDFYLRIQECSKNDEVIKWMRSHPANGISFKEIPDLSNVVELPAIAQMKQMEANELKELCAKNKVEVKDDATKDAIILALLESASKTSAAE